MARDDREPIAVDRHRLADRREQAADERERSLNEREARLQAREANVLRRLAFTSNAVARQVRRESVHEQLDASERAIARSRAQLDREVAAEGRQAGTAEDEQSEIDRQVQRTLTDQAWDSDARETP